MGPDDVLWARFLPAARAELGDLHLRLTLARWFLAPLPAQAGGRVRASLLRRAGFAIGRRSMFAGTPLITGSGDIYGRLTIGQDCWFNSGCHFELGDAITIGNSVSFGHDVLLLTTSHSIGPAGRRAGPRFSRPIVIDDGAWLGSRAIVLPGITIGASSVVSAGAVVTADVPPNTVVAGAPARPVRTLEYSR